MPDTTAHDLILRELTAPKQRGVHYSPDSAGRLLSDFRDQVFTEAAEHLERIADETEAQVAEHYGVASGIGPGSADMVREAARSVLSLATRTVTARED